MMVLWPVNSKLNLWMQSRGIPDGVLRDAISSFGGSAIGVCFFNPFDVLRTRLYNQPRDAAGRGVNYTGMIDCARKVVHAEGVSGLQKGLLANYMRAGPQTMLSLIFMGRIR
eukprot:Hpha_TRINITY_DN18005_c0_g1::TRINITY_DN18005_c0_g1_i1::g.1186::m.1186/K15117/SLC25A34_35, OAC1; solute carrier family 25, member 34/35